MLTEKAYREKKWEKFPLLRKIIENKKIIDKYFKYFGFVSNSDNVLERIRHYFEIAVLVRENREKIIEMSKNDLCEAIGKELYYLENNFEDIIRSFDEEIKNIKDFRLSLNIFTIKNEEFWKLCKHGSPKQITNVIHAGANVNAINHIGDTALHLAVRYSKYNHEIVSALINAGSNVNAKNFMGCTPLHLAIRCKKNPYVIITLIAAGADVNERENCGYTPLHEAAEKNINPRIISALVIAGAKVNVKNKDKFTPLHLAAKNCNNPKVISALIRAGAFVNPKSNQNVLPLHLAALNNNNPAIISVLVKAGSNVMARTADGIRAIDYLESNKNIEKESEDYLKIRDMLKGSLS